MSMSLSIYLSILWVLLRQNVETFYKNVCLIMTMYSFYVFSVNVGSAIAIIKFSVKQKLCFQPV